MAVFACNQPSGVPAIDTPIRAVRGQKINGEKLSLYNWSELGISYKQEIILLFYEHMLHIQMGQSALITRTAVIANVPSDVA